MDSIKVSVGGGVPLLLFIGGAMLSFLTMPEMNVAGRGLSSLAVGFMTAAGGTAGVLGGGLVSGMVASALHKGGMSRALANLIVTIGLFGGLAAGTYGGYTQTRDYLLDHGAAQHQSLPEAKAPPAPGVS